MRYLRFLALLGIFLLPAAYSQAQVAVGVRVGPAYVGAAPVCSYGYYAYYPYACAPYGYYGPQWFAGGVFIGAGPWFHGSEGFRGNVDNSFDPNHGYNGARPKVGDKAAAQRRDPAQFKGNETRDGRGHSGGEKK